VTGEFFQVRENAEGSTVAGLELNAAWRASAQFRVEAGLAAYRSRFDEEQVVFDDTDEGGATVIATRRYLKTPDWTGTAQAVWSPNEAWDVFTGVKVTGPMSVLNQRTGELNRSSIFTVVDAGVVRHVEWGRHHLDISVGVRNLFDQRQRDLESGPDRDSDYVYGPRFARSFYVRGVYHF
jgi:outer membrane receptor for ferrienterochelin and colicins